MIDIRNVDISRLKVDAIEGKGVYTLMMAYQHRLFDTEKSAIRTNIYHCQAAA